ncbi:MAG: plasmid pRiA4b ORF-3 family protein, partial [Desulfobacterales bacterium]|nr:plasmid pRiA4b ORF-3 family protein [Desulfobacterales bacterium]
KNGLKLRRRELLDPRGLCRSPGLRNIALMEMFGLISIRDSNPGRGESRQMDMARRTPLGDALGKLLRGFFTREGFDDREETIRGFGRLQETIKPFFPGWRNNLELPEIVFVDGVYTFKASLQKAWRRIAAPGANFFDDLGKSILEAFDFQDDHLYWFTWQNRFGAEETIHHPYMEGADALTDEIRIGEIDMQPGSSITFVFDFAALWKFNLQLESIDEKDPGLEKPKAIEAGGKPPAQYPEWDADSQWVFDDD